LQRTPIPKLQRLIQSAGTNAFLKKLSLANLGLSDNAAEVGERIEHAENIFHSQPLIQMLESNKSIIYLNLETNYLSGEFMARLFEASLVNQVLQEIKCVNQVDSISNPAQLIHI
jgi:hypothetical protein